MTSPIATSSRLPALVPPRAMAPPRIVPIQPTTNRPGAEAALDREGPGSRSRIPRPGIRIERRVGLGGPAVRRLRQRSGSGSPAGPDIARAADGREIGRGAGRPRTLVPVDSRPADLDRATAGRPPTPRRRGAAKSLPHQAHNDQSTRRAALSSRTLPLRLPAGRALVSIPRSTPAAALRSGFPMAWAQAADLLGGRGRCAARLLLVDRRGAPNTANGKKTGVKMMMALAAR